MSQEPGLKNFGSLFIEHLLTPKLIHAQLRSSIPPVTWIDNEDATGMARLRSIALPESWANSQEIRFKSKVILSISLSIKKLGGLPFNAKVAFGISIIFRAYHPLVLIADIPPLSNEDAFVFDNKEPLEALLNSTIIGKVIENINQSIKNSSSMRLIDLEQKLIQMASFASENPGGNESDGDKTVMLAASDRPLNLRLSPNQIIEGDIIAHPREVVYLKLYAARQRPPCGLMDHDYMIKFALRESTWEQSLTATALCSEYAFAPTYETDDTIRFCPPKAGSYRFRITSWPASCENDSLIKIIQSRKLAEGTGFKDNVFILSDYRQIDFDVLGENLIQIGISNKVIKDKILEQFRALNNTNKLVVSLELVGLGLVDLILVPKKVIVSDGLTTPLGTQCSHNVEVTALIQGIRQQTATSSERLFSIPLKLAMSILVAATNEPLAIQVLLQSVDASQISIDTSRLTAINDMARTILVGLLTNSMVDDLMDFSIRSIKSLLPLSLTTAAIDKVSSDIIKGTATAPGTPRKVFSEINLPTVTLQNNSTSLKAFYLSKGDRINISVSFSQINYCELGSIAVSICDKEHGVLEHDRVCKSRKGTIRLQLDALYDGVHFLHLAAYNYGWSPPVIWEGFNVKASISRQF